MEARLFEYGIRVSNSQAIAMLQEMREWLSDCEWGNMEPSDFEDLSDDVILRGVNRHYDGGVKEFARTSFYSD